MEPALELDRDARAEGIRRIRAYFERERDEALGELGARLLLDFISEELGYLYYNRALRDAQALVSRSHDTLDADLDAARLLPPRALARDAAPADGEAPSPD